MCPPTVQMHIVEELLAMFGTDEVIGETSSEVPDQDEDNMCIISKQAVDGSDGPGVMQLHGWLQGREVLLLVDSGSTSSFVGQRLAIQLKGVCKLPRICRVKVADGVTLQCDSFIPRCPWLTQDHEFVTDCKIISLGAYNAILGMDWLKKHSQMHIDWEAQQMSVTTKERQVELQAVSNNRQQCAAISSHELLNSCKQGSVAYVVHLNAINDKGVSDATIPTDKLRVLEQYIDVFEDPKTLPPCRACDHHIPLMDGAQPVNLRPVDINLN